MKDLKHTQGAWNLTTSLREYNITGTSVHIASVNKDTEINKEEAQANAKLIATAPEMLEALQNSLVQLERFAEMIPDTSKYDRIAQSLDNHFAEVRSAIEKATK